MYDPYNPLHEPIPKVPFHQPGLGGMLSKPFPSGHPLQWQNAMRYAAVPAAAGFLVAKVMNKNPLLYMIGGAVVGVATLVQLR